MTELTKREQEYLARLAIVEVMGEFYPDTENETPMLKTMLDQGFADEKLLEIGFDQDIIDGYRLALTDLEACRQVVEENAAFQHLVSKMQGEHPEAPRSQIQKAVRALVAIPETRYQAALDSGMYDRLKAFSQEARA